IVRGVESAAAKLFSFPDPVNEVSARLVAGGVVLMSVLTIALDQPWLTAVIAYGFVARVLTGPTLSPLGQIVTKGITPRLPLRERPVPGPPKRFAQGMGVAFSLTATVVVLDHSARTFEVDGHHYALVRIEGLPVASAVEYGVKLDGERVWPPPDHDFPPSLIRTLDPDGPVRISFGSCRVAYPHRPPYSLPKDENPEGREVDALYALARRMRREPPDTWP